jgi:hypothetical protein
MPQNLRPVAGWQVLTAQDLIDFEMASKALREQLSRTEAPLDEQVRMRLALWIFETGLETSQADMDLLDRLSQTDSCDRKGNHHDTSDCFGDHQ